VLIEERNVKATILALAFVLALPAALLADVTITHFGYWTREDYIRVEKVFSSMEAREYIILQKFLHAEEYRLPVVSHEETSEGQELLARGGGKTVRLLIRSEEDIAVGFDGDEPTMRVNVLPTPNHKQLFYGYYTRTNYLRVERTQSSGQASEYLVFQDFPSVIQKRVYVKSHTISPGSPRIETFQGGTGAEACTLQIIHSSPKRGTFYRQTLGTLPYVILE
jgi:hypothetical protein